jgi:hypothetical protein
MKQRIPTLEQYIIELKNAIPEANDSGEKFDWNAKELAAAYNKIPNKVKDKDPSSPDIAVWVAMMNLMNEYKGSTIIDTPETNKIAICVGDICIGVHGELSNDGKSETLAIVRAKSPDSEKLADTPIRDWKKVTDDITTEIVTYKIESDANISVINQINKILKRFILIMK